MICVAILSIPILGMLAFLGMALVSDAQAQAHAERMAEIEAASKRPRASDRWKVTYEVKEPVASGASPSEPPHAE